MTPDIEGWEKGQIEQVAPSDARRWIRTSHQRSVDLLKVRKMLDDLADGRWDPSLHERRPVIVSESKQTLADGHHRIMAVLMLGEPIPLMVLRR